MPGQHDLIRRWRLALGSVGKIKNFRMVKLAVIFYARLTIRLAFVPICRHVTTDLTAVAGETSYRFDSWNLVIALLLGRTSASAQTLIPMTTLWLLSKAG